MSYDQKCHDLAIVFLSDHEPLSDQARTMLADELAQRIQSSIEDFLVEHFEETS